MEFYEILLPLALVLFLSKTFSKVLVKFGMPQVVGMLLAGVVIGLINYIPGQTVLNDLVIEGIGFIAKIGVILIMFSAGLETDIKQLKAVGLPAVIVTLFGVIFTIGLGFVVAVLFNGGFSDLNSENFLSCLFYGVILSATSVSVSVATLKELGVLNSKVGNIIISAAILDDIIGIIVLSFVISMKGSGANAASPGIVLLKTFLFFIAAFIGGIFANKLFNIIERKFPHHRLLPIYSVALCFLFAYISEAFFGIADITGAFAVGLALSRNPESDYIDRKSDVMSYMIFAPVFFANIGITADFSGITLTVAAFGICFIIAGMAGKVLGCGLAAKMCGCSGVDSLRIGVGMMARAEVCLVCAQKGVENGLIDSSIMPFIVILIIATSFLTPIIIKNTYRKKELTAVS
ncbi:MAG: cation:proton antiporter [Clostridia bacterium]|nr:cation:proton antiporter [Clostridia bacterium]